MRSIHIFCFFLAVFPFYSFGQEIVEFQNGEVADADSINSNFSALLSRISALEAGGDSSLSCRTFSTEDEGVIDCPTGKVMTGGGYSVSNAGLAPSVSKPEGNGWVCSESSDAAEGVTCFVRCCSTGSLTYVPSPPPEPLTGTFKVVGDEYIAYHFATFEELTSYPIDIAEVTEVEMAAGFFVADHTLSTDSLAIDLVWSGYSGFYEFEQAVLDVVNTHEGVITIADRLLNERLQFRFKKSITALTGPQRKINAFPHTGLVLQDLSFLDELGSESRILLSIQRPVDSCEMHDFSGLDENLAEGSQIGSYPSDLITFVNPENDYESLVFNAIGLNQIFICEYTPPGEYSMTVTFLDGLGEAQTVPLVVVVEEAKVAGGSLNWSIE
jgi:hypothetical protein